MQDVMQQVEIPRAEARQTYLDYRRAARDERDPVVKRELENMARAFRIAAQDELPLIALTPTITRGGTVTRTLVHRNHKGEETGRDQYLLPKVAVCRAPARFCFSLGVQQNGNLEFIDSLGRQPRYQKGRISLETSFELPEGYVRGQSITWSTSAWSALVPIVPPKHRPTQGGLDSLHILWGIKDGEPKRLCAGWAILQGADLPDVMLTAERIGALA